MKPNSTSYPKSFLLKNNGSKNAENNDAVAKQITATEIFATLIAPKKKNQCNATTKPINKRGIIYFIFIDRNCFVKPKNINKAKNAISILCQTRYVVSNEINFPSTPVNPKNSTIRCIEDSLYFFSMLYIN